MKPTSSFIAITTEGGLLPADFLAELLAPKAAIEGLTPISYNLAEGERINEQVNRSWNRLKGRWIDFKKAIADKQPGDSTTTETRDRWLQPIFQELGFGQRLPLVPPIEVDGRSYQISHGWSHVPIHLVGSHLDIDRRTPGAVGAAKVSPHSLVQQTLNASEGHLWGIVSNGLTFRLLRDNIALTRLSYIEWDLAAIFDGDLYSEFFVLWLVAHQSRFDGKRPEQCWLEKWRKVAEDKGLRALDSLRPGVARAIEALGAGLVSHPANKALCMKLKRGDLSTQDFYRQVLRVIYRMLFLFVAEDRGLLHPPLPDENSPKEDLEKALRARARYHDFYAITRLRGLTLHRAGTPHPDLWHIFQLLAQKLGSDTGCPELALPALGSFLWDTTRSTPDLIDVLVSNRHFLTAVHALAFVQDGSVRRPINYKNLGSEELGSVYEGLLELHPLINADTGVFELNTTAGNERKTSGSYYTPDSLVQCLLDSALEPVMVNAVRGKQGQAVVDALLKLKICDPAVGSGHFLIAAAHRLAKRIAAARSDEAEPSPEAIRTALRDVIGRCLYGVDINPMSAELCRVNLWVEALEPGKPLSFLDHHIRVGNSLLGATPELIIEGIPDEAFTPFEGDDKIVCKEFKAHNRNERKKAAMDSLFNYGGEPWENLGDLAQSLINLDAIPDDTPEGIELRSKRYAEMIESQGYRFNRLLADAWCAAFVWKKNRDFPYSITNDVFCQVRHDPFSIYNNWMEKEIIRLRDQYEFFHWHLEFPEVFAQGGFDCVLGNPPWEMPEVDDREFFAKFVPQIAVEPSAHKRRAMIDSLRTTNPIIHEEWREFTRRHEGERGFFFHSGRYPNAANGRLNYYKLFVESSWHVVSNRGHLGMVVPSSLATNAYERPLWHSLVTPGHVSSILDFENSKGLFPSVDSRTKFSLLTLTKTPQSHFKTGCWLQQAEDSKKPQHVMTLTIDEFSNFSPDELTLPQFRDRSDLELLKFTTDKLGRLNDHPDWSYTPRLMFSSSDSVFKPVEHAMVESAQSTLHNRRIAADDEALVPVYEGKMVGILDHRQADIYINPQNAVRQAQERSIPDVQKKDSRRFAIPQFWLFEETVRQRRFSKDQGDWELVFCDVTSATNERTALACIIPLSGLTRNLPAIYLKSSSARDAVLLGGILSTFVLDYFARLKVSSNHLTQGILATLPVPSHYRINDFCSFLAIKSDWLESRALELIYVAWDLCPFAQDYGWSGPPFRWDEERRFLIRCELDAAFFHLYLGSQDEWCRQPESLTSAFPTPRDAVSYIMNTFPIVKRKDEAAYGYYRTKDTILGIYDAMAHVMAANAAEVATGSEADAVYATQLNPPPGPPMVEDGNFLSMYQLNREHWPAHIHPPHPDWDDSLLTAWFEVCQQRWNYLEDDQLFPWDGREAFIYALIPYLAQEKPGEKFDFYRDAALLASRPGRCETLLLDDESRGHYRQAMDGLDWLQFPDSHRLRPRLIRETLQGKQIIQTDAGSGATTVSIASALPPLPQELKVLLPMIIKAADNLAQMQRGALEDAEAAKIAFTQNEIVNELQALTVA